MTPKTMYILIYGPLWGVVTALAIVGWETWIDHQQFLLRNLIACLIIFVVVGTGGAIVTWKLRFRPNLK